MFDDPVLLARIQFALNLSFHILFPTITIALAWVLVYLRIRANRTREAWVEQAYRLWTKLFALSFGLGVVSGITMSFQFGTNWPGFMERAGNIAGPLLGYEVLTAFFLEASFLGIMLFGRDRVPAWLHTLSAVLVAVGTTMSAFWIMVLNAWMQTPQGFEVIDGELQGLNEFVGRHPPVAPVFYAFRVMVGIGVLMIAAAWAGLWLMRRGRAAPRWFLGTLAAMTFSGWVATLAGWIVAEVGRQPYLVYGVLTTAEAASAVPAAHIALTLAGYAFVYSVLLVSYIVVVRELALNDVDGGATPAPQPLRPAPA